MAGVNVDEGRHIELGVRKLALEELTPEGHVADDRFGFVERVVVVDDGARGDSDAPLLGKAFQLGIDVGFDLGRAINALQLGVDEPFEVLVALHDFHGPLVD